MSDLIDRYIWAVAKDLPKSSRDDVARELRATIEDMIDARGSAGDDVTREVLLELGDPAELASSYAGRPRYLVGPRLFPAYAKLLSVALPIVVPIVFAVTCAERLWRGDQAVASGILAAVSAALQTGVMLAFWVTFVFFVLERTGVVLESPFGQRQAAWDPDSLPRVAEKRQIKLGDTIFALVALSLLVAWIPWQRSHSVFRVDGEPVQFLAAGLWDLWIPVLVAVVAASMALEVWKYAVGRWTLPLVVVNLGLNALFAALVLVVLTTQTVVAPAFLATFRDRTGAEFPTVVVGAVLLAVVLLICVWDSVDCVLKYLRARRVSGTLPGS